MSTREPERYWSQALAYPLRVQILEQLIAEQVVSPTDIAGTLGVRRELLSYHMRQLVRFGVVALVERRAVRGVTKHYYRLTDREETIRALEHAQDLARLVAPGRERIDPKAARGQWSLGAAIRTMREKQSISVGELAGRVGLPPNALERIEHGEADPRMSLVNDLANALDLTLHEVLREMR